MLTISKRLQSEDDLSTKNGATNFVKLADKFIEKKSPLLGKKFGVTFFEKFDGFYKIFNGF